MEHKSDLQIAQENVMKPVGDIAVKLNLPVDDLELFGKYKAKIPLELIRPEKVNKSKLILVTAMTPTPAGEGKTTTSIGLTRDSIELVSRQRLFYVNRA